MEKKHGWATRPSLGSLFRFGAKSHISSRYGAPDSWRGDEMWATRQIMSFICSCALAFFSIYPLARSQEADLCAIDRNPSQFCGKMITVRGTTWHGLEHGGLRNDQCQTVVGWKTPEKSGVHVRFKLKRDDSWQTFTRYDAMSSDLRGGPLPLPWLDLQRPTQPPTQPPLHYQVTATFHGLFVCRRRQIPWYFLVLESVSDVKVAPD